MYWGKQPFFMQRYSGPHLCIRTCVLVCLPLRLHWELELSSLCLRNSVLLANSATPNSEISQRQLAL